MSNEIKFYPGYIDGVDNGKREYPPYDIGSMCIVGATGSGKTVLATNVFIQLITLYTKDQINIKVWDGKGVEYVKDYRSAKYTPELSIRNIDVISEAYSAVDKDIHSFLSEAVSLIDARTIALSELGVSNVYQLPKGQMPQVVLFIEEICSTYIDNVDDIKNLLYYILQCGYAVGVHAIVVSQPYINFHKGLPYTYILSTRLDEECQKAFLGLIGGAVIEYAKYGDVVVTCAGSLKYVKYKLPFYEDRKIIEVSKGLITPNGWVPNKRQKSNLKKFMER